jgi:hypothetical protein
MTEYRAANYCVHCKLGPELHLGLEQRCPPLPDLHCPTCQCPRLHAQIPVPGNPMSRSWHDNGCQSADAALVKITSMEQLAAEARKCESLLSSLNGGYGK